MRGLKIQAGSGSRLYPSGSLTNGSVPIPIQMAEAWLAISELDGDPTEVAALLQFVEDIIAVDAGLWNKFYAIYPMRGSDLAHSVYNLVDPEDNDGAYRMTISGTPTLGAAGITFSDASDVMDTKFLPDSTLAAYPFIGFSWYQQAAGYQLFGQTTAPDGRLTAEMGFAAGTQSYILVGTASSGGNWFVTDAGGFWLGQRISITPPTDEGTSLYQPDGTLVATKPVVGPASPTTASGTFRYQGNATASNTFSLGALHTALTPTEVLGFRNAVQNYMTALGIDV